MGHLPSSSTISAKLREKRKTCEVIITENGEYIVGIKVKANGKILPVLNLLRTYLCGSVGIAPQFMYQAQD
jgi:hypothetical protein